MQEFFHKFVINFFLFVTLLKSIGALQSSRFGRNRQRFGAFLSCFRTFPFFAESPGRHWNCFCNTSVSSSVLTMTAVPPPLFPVSRKNFLLFLPALPPSAASRRDGSAPAPLPRQGLPQQQGPGRSETNRFVYISYILLLYTFIPRAQKR